MLEKTTLSESSYGSQTESYIIELQNKIYELLKKVEELRSQLIWLEQENAKNL